MAGVIRDTGQTEYSLLPAFATAEGISSASTSGFIPEIWSGNLVTKFYSTTVFGEIANTDYEGEISSMGDKVQIRTVPSITIRDYTIGSGLTWERPTSPKVELNIDKAKYFAFKANNIEHHQTDLKLMDQWSTDAAEQMKIAVDTDVLANIYAGIDAANKGAAAGADSGNINLGDATGQGGVLLSATNVLDLIVDMGTVMDEQNLPQSGRFLVLPPWACAYIKKSDLKDASIAGDGTSILRNGRVGMIDRFMIYVSNNLAKTNDAAATPNVQTNVIGGVKSGLTFASQMTDMETLPDPHDFGSLIRGLNVYGHSVVEGKHLCGALITQTNTV